MNSVLKLEDKQTINFIERLKEIIKGTKFCDKVYLTDEFIRSILTKNPTKEVTMVIDMERGARRFRDFLASNGHVRSMSFTVKKYEVFSFILKGFEEFDIYCSQSHKSFLHNNIVDESTIYGSIEQDARTRGLTIDAIYYNITTDKVIDPSGLGLMDVFQKRIRTVVHPYLTFNLNPLNMVKTIRIACQHQWGIEKATWMALIQNAREIEKVDMNDFTTELGLILSQKTPSFAIWKMYYSGLLEYVLPEIESMTNINASRCPKKTLLWHTLEVVDNTNENDLQLRFAALFHDYGELVCQGKQIRGEKMATISAQFAELTLKELKLGDKFIANVLQIIKHMDFFEAVKDGVVPSEKLIRKFYNKTENNFASTLGLIQAENMSITVKKKPHLVKNILKRYEDMGKKVESLKKPKLPINGNDIMKEFNIKGEIVGIILSQITDALYDNEALTKDECFNIARQCLRNAAI